MHEVLGVLPLHGVLSRVESLQEPREVLSQLLAALGSTTVLLAPVCLLVVLNGTLLVDHLVVYLVLEERNPQVLILLVVSILQLQLLKLDVLAAVLVVIDYVQVEDGDHQLIHALPIVISEQSLVLFLLLLLLLVVELLPVEVYVCFKLIAVSIVFLSGVLVGIVVLYKHYQV
jgi:hypothetical protein